MANIRSLLRGSVDALTVLVLLGCAVVLYRREFGSRSAQHLTSAVVPDWRDYAQDGSVLVASDGGVTITEFSDFQCPFCKRFHDTEKTLLASYPNRIRVVFRHLPIESIHPNARNAARAAECARSQGKFAEYADALFAHQDSLGTLKLSELAAATGVADTIRFNQCIAAHSTDARIDSDARAAARLGIQGTPTILVNQHLLSGTPSYTALDSVVQLVLRRQ